MSTQIISLPKTLLGFFWKFTKPKWRWFIAMIGALVACSIAGGLRPYALKVVIDSVVGSEDAQETALKLAALPILFYAVVNIGIDLGSRIYEWLRIQIIPDVKAEMRAAMFEYTTHHSFRYFQDNLSGTISNKIIDMVRGFENLIVCVFDVFFPVTLIMLFFTGLLWSVHWVFGAITLGWFIAYMAALIRFGRTNIRYSDDQSEAGSHISGRIVDVLRNMSTVRMFARLPFETKQFRRDQASEVRKSAQLLHHMWLTHVFQGAASVLLLIVMMVVSVYGWQEEWLTIGDFTLIANSSLTLVFFNWWMGSQFPIFFKELGVCKQALTVIRDTHDIVDKPDAKALRITDGKIEYDDVTFEYRKGAKIFTDKTVTLNSKEKVGLVGFSGSGKTTFVNLIMRYFDLHAGTIRIDGQDISQVTQQSLREQIAVIPQDPILFHRSLMENIRYGKLDATDDEVYDISKKAHCHEFIQQLEEQYNSLVGEGGVKLSGGQRQRIAIARAMLKDAPILILDEATSALDSATERNIQESLHSLMADKTTIVIAHRLSTLLNMDRILVFDQGKIIESGSHQELLRAKGHYHHLWELQQDGFIP